MKSLSQWLESSASNPLNLVEELLQAREWNFERLGEDEVVASVTNQWCDCRLYFIWSGEMSAMQFSAVLDMRVPKARRAATHELLALVNNKAWMGHFELAGDTNLLVFRHTVPLRGAGGVTAEQLEDLVDSALGECERAYPAFQYVIWGGKGPAEALAVALIETKGEA